MIEEGISNYSGYNEGMKKSLLDKIFFMDKVESTVFVDYGCADGTLIHFLSQLFPEYMYIGYDVDENMLKLAREKCPDNSERFLFTSDWKEVTEYARSGVATIILSSTIHEVYAYGTRKDVDSLWRRVFNGVFEYVVIRDMIPSISADKRSDINDVAKLLKKADKSYLFDFEHNWGSIETNKNLMHFLLKYRYADDWSREVKENYFPVLREELISSIPDEYEIEFHEHFVLPFLKRVVKKDFNIDLKDNTHLKLILKHI